MRFLVVRSVCALHTLWGLLLLAGIDVGDITALASVIRGTDINNKFFGVYLLVTAGLAFSQTLTPSTGKLRYLWFFPQHLLLIRSALSAFEGAYFGQYPDGTIKPGIFILADQLPIVFIMLMYTYLVTLRPARDTTYDNG
jgi:hypothetical protein